MKPTTKPSKPPSKKPWRYKGNGARKKSTGHSKGAAEPALEKRLQELAKLEEHLRIKFKDKMLLNQALTHPSYVAKDGKDNGRLEFLGDSFIGLTISHLLYDRNPKSDEGELTKWKSYLVSSKFFAELPETILLGKHLQVGPGERRSGPPTASMLAATLESVVGALYLDNGYQKTFKFIENLYLPYLKIAEKEEENFKGVLQELLQRKYKEQPQYDLVGEEGPDHAKTFEVQVSFRGKVFGIGHGSSKKEAEKEAAKEALGILGRE